MDDLEIIQSAMKQLSAVNSEVSWEKSKSYHGSPQTILEMRINNKKNAKKSLELLGKSLLNQLVENGIESQIDDDKIFHIRLSLSSLVAGKLRLAEVKSFRELLVEMICGVGDALRFVQRQEEDSGANLEGFCCCQRSGCGRH